ncbi:MAG: ABC transporter substrate-binding protein [Aquabacterium sp.]
MGSRTDGRRKALLAAVAALLGPAAVPLSFGQGPPPRALRIGVLRVDKVPASPRFVAAMAALGYVEGRNLTFERREADGDAARLPALAAELVQRKVDVILTFTTADTNAAQLATKTTPILMMGVGGDPVASALVASLSRPGGNVTGFVGMGAEQSVKRLELLKDLLPGLKKAALLGDAQMTEATRHAVRQAAAALRVDLVMVDLRHDSDIATVIAELKSRGVQALTMASSPLVHRQDKRIAALALQHGLAWAASELTTNDGALLGSSPDMRHVVTGAASLIDRIARGARPGDIPVEQPTRFLLSINLKTARALGVKPSPAFMTRVDRTVE